ncbi:MAG TPA: hypothetical protein PLU30_23730 [Verrucomicrobiae bacterium]|nr:hypothetical protein [Verrucomicrobiae bacterium]
MGSLEQRRMQAEAIMASPSEYKVCEGCGSILRRTAAICPLCKSYRFDASEEKVVAQAKELGSREATTISEEDWE